MLKIKKYGKVRQGKRYFCFKANMQEHLPVNKWNYKGVSLAMLRLDLTDHAVSGNKWFKLKYNLKKAKDRGFTTILTFGGAFSNHIYATAAASHAEGIRSIGVIRGEELQHLNSTLQFAVHKGMKLHYVSREDYRKKAERDFIEILEKRFGDFFLIPEGGSNELAVQGAAEIAELTSEKFDYWITPVGTGGTIAGIISGIKDTSEVIGFSSLKGAEGGLEAEVEKLIPAKVKNKRVSWQIIHKYHFGGYAKLTEELYNFILQFRSDTGILLDPIYTGKMMFGLYDLIEKGEFSSSSKIMVLHTGGLQGWNGMARRYKFVDPSLSFNRS